MQQIKLAGCRCCEQRLISGKMTGTVRGAETDGSFVQLWAVQFSNVLKCSVAALGLSGLHFMLQFGQGASVPHTCIHGVRGYLYEGIKSW